MAAIATRTLKDHAAADVAFAPNRIDSTGVALWVGPESIYDAQSSVTQLVKRASNGSAVNRVTGKVVIPIMDSVATTTKVGDLIASFEFVLPKVATENQRLDILAAAKAAIGDSVTLAAVQKIESAM